MGYKGKYDRTIFQNAESGYCIISIKTADSRIPEQAKTSYRYNDHLIRFVARGYGLPLTDAVEFEMEGEWESSEHGYQLMVEHWQEIIPQTIGGIQAYLASGLIKGIGEKTAEAIVRRFGLNTLDVLEHQPEKLLEVKGITESKLEDIKESYYESRVIRNLMTFLAPFKVTPKTAAKIHQEFGAQSVSIIREKPYELCKISGFGFKKVDAIALKTSCGPNDPMRIRGAILYVLGEICGKEGHLFLTTEDLCQKTRTMLNERIPPPVHVQMQDVSNELYNTVVSEQLIANHNSIYLPKHFSAEDLVARFIADMLLDFTGNRDVTTELNSVKRDIGLVLSTRQEEAVKMVFAHNLSIVTGSPGTGKTTILQAVIHVFRKLNPTGKLLLAAPTGKASRRMAESTGVEEAKTLHSALGLISSDNSRLNSTEPVDADLVIVDETSMVDMWLASQLFARLTPGTRVLLVGDADQLPSVGAGNVFRELISCGRIPVTILNEIFRQSRDSLIAYNAKFIMENNTDLYYGHDFTIDKCDNQQEASEHILARYLQEVERVGIENVQILSPFRSDGDVSAEKLNDLIREYVNPPSSETPELRTGFRVFRQGDRVMQTKNKRNVSNGDVGFIQSIRKNDKGICVVTIEFLDARSSRIIEYEPSDLDVIDLAYAMTIHKAMGSEYHTIIMPIMSAHTILLNRNMLYTAITRAKQRVILVGQKRTLYIAIHKTKIDQRNTWLGYRINRYCESQEKQRKAG